MYQYQNKLMYGSAVCSQVTPSLSLFDKVSLATLMGITAARKQEIMRGRTSLSHMPQRAVSSPRSTRACITAVCWVQVQGCGESYVVGAHAHDGTRMHSRLMRSIIRSLHITHYFSLRASILKSVCASSRGGTWPAVFVSATCKEGVKLRLCALSPSSDCRSISASCSKMAVPPSRVSEPPLSYTGKWPLCKARSALRTACISTVLA